MGGRVGVGEMQNQNPFLPFGRRRSEHRHNCTAVAAEFDDDVDIHRFVHD